MDIERLSELYGRVRNLSHSDKLFIKETYEKEFKLKMSSTCSNCYADALIYMMTKIRNYKALNIKTLNNNNMETKKSKYELKRGVIINNPEIGIVTNANITDEVAKEYLKNYPNRINLFAYFPDDWNTEQEIEVEEQEIETTVKKPAAKPKKPS